MSDKSVGVKFDQGKPQYRLLPVRGIHAIVEVLTFGVRKYSPDNWMKVQDAPERYEDAMLRHIFAWKGGEALDPESGLHHLGHAGCCLLFLLHFELDKVKSVEEYEEEVTGTPI